MSQPTSPSAADVVSAIRIANAGREPERLAMKYAKMAQSPFSLLRGACHLFYPALPDSPLFRGAPLAWCCGDLHFENFGSYKGDNRLVYFDINDYDEAALAPASWDLLRLLSSIRCGAETLHISDAQAQALGSACLDAYRRALVAGKPLWVERETANGLVRDLFDRLQNLKRPDFLDKRTILKSGRRQLKVDGIKALPASADQRASLCRFMAEFAARQAAPKFFEVLDCARRIAGTGSLGIERFVVLIAGKGSPDGNYLLDIKEARPSALAPTLARLDVEQPAWADEASRVVAVQQRMQAIDHAFLQPVRWNDRPFILRGLQPSEDRVAIGDWGKKLNRLDEVVASMGRILAWDQLRAAGRAGSANADALIAFAQDGGWSAEMLQAADDMSQLTRQQWQAFTEAWAAGRLA
ncbi:MAG: DUF2252 domain-containing protein [Bacteroidota bacterium]